MPRPKSEKPAPEIGDSPLPTPDDLPAELKGRRGPARTGKWPIRKPRKKAQKGHAWALENRWQPIFVEALSRYGIMSIAADKAGVHVSTVYNERKREPEFDAAVNEAMVRYADGVEAEVAFRALEGYEKFVVDKQTGQPVSVGKCPNDILLMFYMKKLRPEFRENYKSDDDRQATQALQQIVVNFLKGGFDPSSDDQADAPTLEAFVKEQPSLPAPETADQKRARLLAELAALDEEAKGQLADEVDDGRA